MPPTFNLPLLIEEAFDLGDSAPPDDLEGFLEAAPAPKIDHFNPLPTPTLAVPRTQSHANVKRAIRRKAKAHEEGHMANHRTLFEHAQLADPVSAEICLGRLPTTKGGYQGSRFMRDRYDHRKEYALNDLLGLGIEILQWDGRYAWKSYLDFLF